MRKRITVFCGSAEHCPPVYRQAAEEMGKAIARQGRVLVYGSGTCGLMGLVANGAKAEGGKIVGVNARCFEAHLPHPETDELLMLDTLPLRKEALIREGDACVALPGGMGTWDELTEVYALVQAGLMQKPLGLLNVNHYYDGFLMQLRQAVQDGFMREKDLRLLQVSDQPEELLRLLDADS